MFFFYILDAILNMVNNIAANVLGATPELEGGTESEGTDPSCSLTFPSVKPVSLAMSKTAFFLLGFHLILVS